MTITKKNLKALARRLAVAGDAALVASAAMAAVAAARFATRRRGV